METGFQLAAIGDEKTSLFIDDVDFEVGVGTYVIVSLSRDSVLRVPIAVQRLTGALAKQFCSQPAERYLQRRQRSFDGDGLVTKDLHFQRKPVFGHFSAQLKLFGHSAKRSYTLTQNVTVTLPTTDDLITGSIRAVTVIAVQDSTGGRTFTLAAPSGYSIVYNNSSTQPAVNSTANKTTIYTALLIKGVTDIYVSLSFYEA